MFPDSLQCCQVQLDRSDVVKTQTVNLLAGVESVHNKLQIGSLVREAVDHLCPFLIQ